MRLIDADELKKLLVFNDKPLQTIIYAIIDSCKEIGNTLEFYKEDFGKIVFLTREEAEKALKENEKNG